MSSTPDRLLDSAETRQRLGGLGRTALWQLSRDGQLPCVKIGRRVFWPESAITAYIRALQAAGRDGR